MLQSHPILHTRARVSTRQSPLTVRSPARPQCATVQTAHQQQPSQRASSSSTLAMHDVLRRSPVASKCPNRTVRNKPTHSQRKRSYKRWWDRVCCRSRLRRRRVVSYIPEQTSSSSPTYTYIHTSHVCTHHLAYTLVSD
jgi:hypothetical protein